MSATPEQLKERWKTPEGQRMQRVLKHAVATDRWPQFLEGFPYHGELGTDRDLRGIDLSGMVQKGVHLRKTDLSYCSLAHADLSFGNLSEALLVEATLDGANLTGVNLSSSDLHGARLRGARLIRANLSSACLSAADLTSSSLYEADCYDVSLIGATLTGTDLMGVRLVLAKLSNAELTGAKLYGTSRDDWRIDGIKCAYIYWDFHGAERYPKSRDFSCGEFERLFSWARPLALESTNEFDAFLCYASEDREAIVAPFAKQMIALELRPWWDKGEVRWGDPLLRKIQDGLTKSRVVVIFVSTSFAGKNWPEAELNAALSMEIGGKAVVLPLVLGISHQDLEARYPMVSAKRYETILGYDPTTVVKSEVLARLMEELKLRLT